MNCLGTFKSAEDITLIRYYATGKLEMQGSAKLLHLYHYGNYLCLITGECNIFLYFYVYLYIYIFPTMSSLRKTCLDFPGYFRLSKIMHLVRP